MTLSLLDFEPQDRADLIIDAVVDVFVKTHEAGARGAAAVNAAASISQDMLAVTGAAQVLRKFDDHERNNTLETAAQYLQDLLEQVYQGKGTESHRYLVAALRRDDPVREHYKFPGTPARIDRHVIARRMLANILEDEAIGKYWRERAHYHRPPELTPQERRELGHLIALHFAVPAPTKEGFAATLVSARQQPDERQHGI